MPTWYAEFRMPILLLQSVVGVLVFAYSLNPHPRVRLRLVLGTGIGCAALHLGRLIFFPGMTDTVNSLGRVVLSIAAYLVLIVICWFVYQESFWTALFVASSGYIAQDLAGTLKMMLKLIPAVNGLCQDPLGILAVDLLAYYGFYIVLFFIFRPFTRNREENFDNREKTVFSFVVLLFCLGMARLAQGNPDRNQTAVFAECLYQILCDLFILLLQFGVMERARLSRSVDTMRELVHQQHEQFRQSKESTDLVNEKYHDLKDLLESFQGRISQEQIDAMKEKIGTYDTYVKTGNQVLDIVLAEKRAICNQKGIIFTCYADGTGMEFTEELDLYSLVSNALNNAIDAVSKLPEGERFISLSAKCTNGMLMLHVENPFCGSLTMEDGLPKSSRDERYHGFGMKSMKRIAEKYDGTLSVQSENGIFGLDALLLKP